MNFADYEQKYEAIYAEFAAVVRSILEKAIDATEGVPAPQSIQCRAKAASHLKPKLQQRGILESSSIENEIKDLAGVRLIFYTNTDVERFLNSGLIWNNFSVEEGQTRVHHPRPENERQLYQAIHYTVRLNPERTRLAEYTKFADFRCEIQIQTILNHAWAETSHDILYKAPESKGFGGKAMESIEKRLMRVMDEYLLPAGYELQKAQQDFERLMQGKALFDRGAIQALENCNDNNERHEIITKFKDYLLPHYDDVEGIYPELRSALLKAHGDAKLAPPQPISTPFGDLPGKTAEDVAILIVEIIEDLRYVDVNGTLDALTHLYRDHPTSSVRERVMKAVEELARYDLNVWRQVGPAVQMQLSTTIGRLTPSERGENRDVLVCVWREFLKSELRGVSWSADAATLSTGAVPASPELTKIRDLAIGGLSALFDEAPFETQQREVMQALWEATRLPTQAGFSNEMVATVLSDARRIVTFMTNRISAQSYTLQQHFEHECLFYYKRWHPVLTGETDRFACRGLVCELLKDILIFRDTVNANEQYVRYKTLVGYESVFPWQWDENAFDYKRTETYRDQRIEEYVDAIRTENEDEWYDLIERCAATKSNDMATFPTFGKFLATMAKRRPEIAISFLARANDDVLRFLAAFLNGLFESEKRDAFWRIVGEYIDEGRQLWAIARQWRISKPDRPGVVVRLLQKAVEVGDDAAVIECVGAAVANHQEEHQPTTETFFAPAIRYLTSKGDTRWVNEVWYQNQATTFFPELSHEHTDLVLANLVEAPRIDAHIERILSVAAKARPEPVWRFFGLRLVKAHGDDKADRYEAIPYQFFDLQKQLSQVPEFAIDLARTWYEPDRRALFQFEGGRLLYAAFPDFPDAFGTKLRQIASDGTTEDIGFVLSILWNYNGDPRTHEVMKTVAAKLSEDDTRIVELEGCLFATGVVSGEFGIADAYRRKKAEIASWLEDESPRVRSFAEKAIRNLDLRVAADHRRAEQHREMRRREFDREEP
jgi:ppGpp synthetase/RelA/SpoT-type nucleotidyltranferase